MFYTAGALERGNRRQLLSILMQVDARIHPRFDCPGFHGQMKSQRRGRTAIGRTRGERRQGQTVRTVIK